MKIGASQVISAEQFSRATDVAVARRHLTPEHARSIREGAAGMKVWLPHGSRASRTDTGYEITCGSSYMMHRDLELL